MKEKDESRIGELEGISAARRGVWILIWQCEHPPFSLLAVAQAPPIITACCLSCSPAPSHLLTFMNLKFTFGYFHLHVADMYNNNNKNQWGDTLKDGSWDSILQLWLG